MPRDEDSIPPKVELNPTELKNTVDHLPPDQREVLEHYLLNACSGDQKKAGKILTICCANTHSDGSTVGKTSQLSPQYLKTMDGLQGTSDSTFTRTRKMVNSYPPPDSPASRELRWLIRMHGYQADFVENPNYSPRGDFPQKRIISLDQLFELERPIADGGHGHLHEGSELIIQGSTPLIRRREMANIVESNMKKGIRYVFVFGDNTANDIAETLASYINQLLLGGRLANQIASIGDRLEIWLTTTLWPFVVSVHNAENDVKAKSYLRIPDSDYLLELWSGQAAFHMARQIRNSLIKDDQSRTGWLRSPVAEGFRNELLRRTIADIHPRLESVDEELLKGALFGQEE